MKYLHELYLWFWAGELNCLENLINLEVLTIRYIDVPNLQPISKLTNLKELKLNGNKVDLAPLSNLEKLKVLNLEHNESDITPISKLNNLEVLILRLPRPIAINQ